MKVFEITPKGGHPSHEPIWVLDSGDAVEKISYLYGAECHSTDLQPTPDLAGLDFILPRDAGRLAKTLREARPQ